MTLIKSLVKTINFVLFLSLSPNVHSKIIKHTFNVSYFNGAPDGVYKEKILGINGQFPGPAIYAEIGDELAINVINNIQDGQNASIHWHGLHQKGQYCQDGASQISQCPLKNGHSQQYRFNLYQSGTFWYHSHVGSQYSEGLWGILIVQNVPEVYKYDDEITITLNDWYHRTAKENEDWHLSPISRGVPPYPDTGMINGLGRYPCNHAKLQNRSCRADLQKRAVFKVQRNKTYRIRVINTSSVAAFNFSIDGHILETIEVDGIDVRTPVPVDIAFIAVAQRYSFLIRTKCSFDRYVIRAKLRKESLMLIEGANINNYPEALIDDVTAVLENSLDSNSSQLLNVSTEPHSYLDSIPLPSIINPIYLNENDLSPYDGIPAPNDTDQKFVLQVEFNAKSDKIRRGSFNHTPFVLPSDKPLLHTLLNGEPIPDNVFHLELGYMNVVELVINNPNFGPHPFHERLEMISD